MERFLTALFLLATSVQLGCSSAEKAVSNSPYIVSLTNVVTKKADENENRGSRGIHYSVSGDVSLSRDGKPVEVSGELILSVSEVTGFLSYGDEPRFYQVPIVKGKGSLEVSLDKFWSPQEPASLPKVNFRTGNFSEYESVEEYSDGEVKPNERLVKLDISPLKVIEDGAYRADGELKVTGLGSLSKATFSLFVLRTTLEHPQLEEVGDRLVYQFVVNNGEGKLYVQEYLGVSKDTDSNFKEVRLPTPSVPKYKYEVMGIRMQSDAVVRIR